MNQIQIILNIILIFFVFFLICTLVQFLKYMDNKKDKRNLLKLKKECPDALIIVEEKILNIKYINKITIYINNQKREIDIVSKIDEKADMITLYSDDSFCENITNDSTKYKSCISKTFKIYGNRDVWMLAIDCEGESVIIESNVEYKKHSRIKLVKKIGEKDYKIKDENDNAISTKDKDLGNDLRYLLIHENIILAYNDYFIPNYFVNITFGIILTIFVLFVTSLVK